jgi:hypothetical protein
MGSEDDDEPKEKAISTMMEEDYLMLEVYFGYLGIA